MDVLNTANIADVLQVLREHLMPVGHKKTLIDANEGELPHARRAAVLLPLFELHGETYLLFIRRSRTLRSHGGEIAFPGGKIEPGETFPVMTALREAHEEIGLEPARVEILGVLPPVFTVLTNYLITPVVAYLPLGPGHLTLQPSEVTEVIQLPLRGLADPAIAHTEQWVHGGKARTVYFYNYHVYNIWGATGRMFSMLLTLLQE